MQTKKYIKKILLILAVFLSFNLLSFTSANASGLPTVDSVLNGITQGSWMSKFIKDAQNWLQEYKKWEQQFNNWKTEFESHDASGLKAKLTDYISPSNSNQDADAKIIAKYEKDREAQELEDCNHIVDSESKKLCENSVDISKQFADLPKQEAKKHKEFFDKYSKLSQQLDGYSSSNDQGKFKKVMAQLIALQTEVSQYATDETKRRSDLFAARDANGKARAEIAKQQINGNESLANQALSVATLAVVTKIMKNKDQLDLHKNYLY